MKKHTFAILSVICIFALASCFSPFDGGNEGEGTIVINIGASNAARIPVSTPSEMTHIITLTGPGGTINRTLDGPTGTIAVAPGTWTINIDARGPNEYFPMSTEFGLPTDIILRAVGSPTNVTVTAGASASATISMISAAEVSNEAQLRAAVTWARADGGEKRIRLTATTPITLTTAPVIVTGGRNITLVANSGTRTINRTGFTSQPMFQVDSPGTLRLGIPGMVGNIAIVGDAGANAAIIEVNPSADLIMNANVTLTDNTSGSGGGAVQLNAGTFTMYGGTISDNEVTGGSSGGGVAVNAGSAFTMSGGIISDNIAGNAGGGVVNDNIFIMSGGTISGNDASTSGGGVTNWAGSTFTMSGGAAINNNTAGTQGGGVRNDGNFTMNGSATINNNAASFSGGGVHNEASGNIIMSGGAINGNVATSSDGGGVHNGGSFTMSGGSTINGNTAGGAAGGVHNLAGASFIISDVSTINNNTAVMAGGGVNNIGNFTMSGGAINNNTTIIGNGGGVHNAGGIFFIQTGTINGNTAGSTNGQAMFVMSPIAAYGTTLPGTDFSGPFFDGGGVSRNGNFSVTNGVLAAP